MVKERVIIEVTETGTRKVQRRLTDVGKASGGALSAVQSLKTALAGLGVGLLLREGIRTLANFGQEMSTIAAITKATGNEFSALTDRAKELGATTRFTASQAASAMTTLARAGFTVTETMESVGDVLLLAQAGGLDLASAANIAASTLRGFRLEVDQTQRVVDVLAVAANSANTDVTQLGEGLKFVAPIAAGVGLTLEETAASLATLSDSGLQASLSGTSLRIAIAKLKNPSREAQRVFEALNITAEDLTVATDTGGLAGAFARLAKKGIDTTRALKVFEVRGAAAFEILANGARKTDRLTKKFLGLNGETKEIARVMDDNLNGALKKVASAIESVVLAFGKVRGGKLQKVFEGLATAIRFLGERIEIIHGLLIGVGLVALPLVIKGVLALNAAIGLNPAALLIIALGAAIGALAAFKDELKLSEDGWISLGDVFNTVMGDISRLFQGALSLIRDGLRFIGVDTESTVEKMDMSFRGIVFTVASVVDHIIATFKGLGEWLKVALSDIPASIAHIFFMMGKAVLKALNWAFDNFGNEINKVLRRVEETLNTWSIMLGGQGGFFFGDANFGQIAIPELPEGRIKDQGERAGKAFADGFVAAGAPVTDYITNLINRAGIEKGENLIKEFATNTANNLAAAIDFVRAKGVTGTIAAGGQAIAGGAQDLSEAAGDRRAKAVAKAANEAGDGFSNAKTEAEEFNDFVTGQLNQGLNDTVRNLADISGGLSGAFTGALNSATDALADFAVNGFQSLEDLKAAFSDLFAQLAKDILSLILKMLLLKAISSAFGESGGGVLGGVVGAVTGNAAGGPVAGGIPTIVGERGPELFVPPSQGNIVPNSQMGQGEGRGVTIINVDSEDSVPAAMDGAAGDQVILNSITRQRDVIKRTIS